MVVTVDDLREGGGRGHGQDQAYGDDANVYTIVEPTIFISTIGKILVKPV